MEVLAYDAKHPIIYTQVLVPKSKTHVKEQERQEAEDLCLQMPPP